MPTYFLGLIGYKTLPISGSSTSSFTLNPYIDFYLMLDVSGSMSMPSTTAEQARLQAVNPDNLCNYPTGCTFACHFTAQGGCGQSYQGPYPPVGTSRNPPTNPSPGGYCQGFIISRLGTSRTVYASGNNYQQRQYGELEQHPGQLVPDGRHHVVHPAAHGRGRLCGEPAPVDGVDDRKQRRHLQSIPRRHVPVHPEPLLLQQSATTTRARSA